MSRYQFKGKVNLEIPPNDEEINALPVIDFTSLGDRGVDSVESAMTLALRQRSNTQWQTQSY